MIVIAFIVCACAVGWLGFIYLGKCIHTHAYNTYPQLKVSSALSKCLDFRYGLVDPANSKKCASGIRKERVCVTAKCLKRQIALLLWLLESLCSIHSPVFDIYTLKSRMIHKPSIHGKKGTKERYTPDIYRFVHAEITHLCWVSYKA